jgi:hypothetical protein
MGDCRYCSKPAGFLKKQHSECAEKCRAAHLAMVILAQEMARDEAFDSLEPEFRKKGEAGLVPAAETRAILVEGWKREVDRLLEDNLITDEEEGTLTRYTKHFELQQEELDSSGTLTRLVKAGVLRDLSHGKIEHRLNISGNLPFNFSRGESVIWVFPKAEYLEQKTQRRYEGGSAGVSFRVARGVYLRTSAFHGRPIDATYTAVVDTGIMCITNKSLYFSGAIKGFRIALDKISTIQPHSDGVTVFGDSSSAKPQTFRNQDGWFTYNLLMNVSHTQTPVPDPQ